MKQLDAIIEYAKKNYKALLREPDGNLKYKFIVPGSVYDNSLWDWDSWLTDIALREFVQEDLSEYEKGCVLNFLELIDDDGRIPIEIETSDMLPHFEKNSETNIHKPCLAMHADFICQTYNDYEWLRPHFLKLLKFIECYYNNFRHRTGLYYWIDDSAIGVDNDPCTFYRPKKSSGSIFLNCMMYKEIEAVCHLGEKLGINIDSYRIEGKNLKNAIRKYCFDEKDGFYYSVDFNLLPVNANEWLHSGAPRHWDCLIQRIGSWSGFLAMWSGVAKKEQAERMVKENLLDENSFWSNYGVRTLSKYEKMYSLAKTDNPSCWLGPIWGISNYLTYIGLKNYGFEKEAKELAQRTVSLIGNDILKNGEPHEYYNPETGEPINHPGFQSWNLLAIKMGKDL